MKNKFQLPTADIVLQNIYKIFGPDEKNFIDILKTKISKKEFKDLYGNYFGLRGVNVSFSSDRIEVIMGKPRSGKTTLMRIIHGAFEPTAGELNIKIGTEFKTIKDFKKSPTTMVFLMFDVVPHRTVFENIDDSCMLDKLPPILRRQEINEWLNYIGLGGFENRYPKELSKNMQRRLGLLRALSMHTPIVLIDEVFVGVELTERRVLHNILTYFQKMFNKTVLVITHDIEQVFDLDPMVTIINEGQIVQRQRLDKIILDPQDDYVKTVIDKKK